MDRRIAILTLTLVLVMLSATFPVLAARGEKNDAELGAYFGLNMPDSYGMFAPKDDSLYGVRFGVFITPAWSTELSLQRMTSGTEFPQDPPTPNVNFEINSLRINGLYNFRRGHALRPFVTAGLGVENTDIQGLKGEDDWGINLGAGARYFFKKGYGIRMDLKYVMTEVSGPIDDGQTNMEVTIGGLWAFGGKAPGDEDGDGVRDDVDKCSGTPTGAIVDKKGCPLDGDADGVPDGLDKCIDTQPEVPVDEEGCDRDSDGDGVIDFIDKCADTPQGARVDESGCPTDADGDGVFDGLDKCANTPKGAEVNTTGCPDTDGDGVFDDLDKCSGTKSGAMIDENGCPIDADGDGVADGLDKCADTPPGAEVDEMGCPDTDNDGVSDALDKCALTPDGEEVDEKGCKLLFVPDRPSVVLQGVNFEFNSDKLTPEAEDVLGRVADSLIQWPEIQVIVAGHTDSVGDGGYNKRLSVRRAEKVREFLIGKTVDASRMTTKGYGEERPLVENTNDDNRALNRRVELEKGDPPASE